MSCAWNDLLPLGQAEPGDHSFLIRSANSLDETPLVLELFDHANRLPKPDGQLVTQRRNVERSNDHQSGAASIRFVSRSLCRPGLPLKTRTYSFLGLIDMREEMREPIDWVFVLGLNEAERMGLGSVVAPVSQSGSKLRAGAGFLLEVVELFIPPGL